MLALAFPPSPRSEGQRPFNDWRSVKLKLTALALVIFFCAVTTATAKNPIKRLRDLRAQERELLVPGPTDWKLLRDVERYRHIRREEDRMWHRIVWEPYWAIRYVFGVRWPQAWRVSLCEGGRPIPSPRAHNGQYLGMFQMGKNERHLYGHGPSPLAQARAAFRYSSGGRNWEPWSCKP